MTTDPSESRLNILQDEANRVNTGRHRLLVAKNRAVEKVVEVIAAIQQLEDERGPILDTVKVCSPRWI